MYIINQIKSILSRYSFIYSGNIKSGVKIFNVTGTLVEDDSMKLVRAKKTVSANGTATLPATTDINSIYVEVSGDSSNRQYLPSGTWSWGKLYGNSTSGHSYTSSVNSNTIIYYSYWE